MTRPALPLSRQKTSSLKKFGRLAKTTPKSPFSKGGFRGIIKNFLKISPSPLLSIWGGLASKTSNNFTGREFHFFPGVLFIICALLLSGCLLAPKYERDPEKVPQEYRFQDLAGQPQPGLKSLADLTWWELFQDPVLQDLIQQALAANYDQMTRFDERLVSERPVLKNLQNKYGFSSVLDAACGTGLHAIILAGMGFKVCGADISGEMIKQARANAKRAAVDVTWITSPMQQLSRHINGTFDAIICLGNSIAHLNHNDLKTALAEFHRLLAKQGYLILQLLNYSVILLLQIF